VSYYKLTIITVINLWLLQQIIYPIIDYLIITYLFIPVNTDNYLIYWMFTKASSSLYLSA